MNYMSKNEKFNFDIANLKQDFAIENMNINDQDIKPIEMYSNNLINEQEMINMIKNNFIKGV